MGTGQQTAQQEVATLTSDLIRIDTTNPGDDSGPGERAAAEHVAALLAEVGLEPVILESRPRRASVVTRIPGADPDRPALLIHGHLDVVPADAADWTRHPMSGEIVGEVNDGEVSDGDVSDGDVNDGQVWGRGAVDMKNMVAMMLAVIRQRMREQRKPPRDIVLAFPADEEAGGTFGAEWLVQQHPDLFEGVTEAIGEVGGFSVTLGGRRLYLVQTAEKGIAWMRLTARGTAGHGSMLQPDNAVTELADAVARLGRHDWPVRLTQPVEQFLAAACAALGLELRQNEIEPLLSKLGPVARMVGATVRNTVNPTVLTAGYKVNVVPGSATAQVDGRFLPGHEDEFFAGVDALLGAGVRRDFVKHSRAVQTTFDGPLVEAMGAALIGEDPDGTVVPYCLSGGTDAKAFSTLGIRCFGFAPLRLPAELDFTGMFHGVDERVPISALQFGTRVLDRFIDLALSVPTWTRLDGPGCFRKSVPPTVSSAMVTDCAGKTSAGKPFRDAPGVQSRASPVSAGRVGCAAGSASGCLILVVGSGQGSAPVATTGVLALGSWPPQPGSRSTHEVPVSTGREARCRCACGHRWRLRRSPRSVSRWFRAWGRACRGEHPASHSARCRCPP